MAELEVRELEYFVVVAEELHFARAAARLHIAQPALSRSVARMESRLDVRLLDRDSRHVQLTPAGEALLHHAKQVLAAVERAALTTRTVAHHPTNLRLVLKPGSDDGLIAETLAGWERRTQAPRIAIVFGGLTDRVDHLRDGRADLALLWQPMDDTTGLTIRELFVEERVAVLSIRHPLSALPTLRLADLANQPRVHWRGTIGEAGPEISSISELVLLAALGRAIAVLPRSTTGLLGPDVAAVPVLDAEPSRAVLAWRPGNESPALLAFAAATARTAALRRESDAMPARADSHRASLPS